MAGSAPFPRLKSPDPIINRLQDNIANQLQPLGNAIAKTPLLDGAVPSWISPNLLNGVLNNSPTFTPVGFRVDGLLQVYGKGVIINSTGGTLTSIIAYVLPAGLRPKDLHVFASVGVVAGAVVAQSFTVGPNGAVTILGNLLNGNSMTLEFVILAEQ